MIDRRVLAACALLLLGCGARTSLNDLYAGDDGGDPGFGGQPGFGGAAVDECTAPSAEMATWDSPLAFLPIYLPLDGDVANDGALSIYSASSTSTDFTTGMFEQALRVGEPGFVELTDSHELFADTDQLTIALWFRQADGVSGMPLLDCRSQTSGFHTYRSSNGLTTCWGAGTPQVGPGGCMSIDFDDCDWHHLIIRQTEGFNALDVYLDGNWQGEIGEPGFDMFALSIPDLRLGQSNIGGFENTSIIEIDELRIYETAGDDATQCEWIVGGTWQADTCVF